MRRLLLLASTVVLVDTSFYAAITPLLPDLTEQYGLSKTGAGLLAAAYPAGTFAGGLPGGWMAAKVGVKPTVLLGLGLMVVSSVGFAFANSVLFLDVARFVQGVGGAASWAGAMGWLAAASPRDQRGQMIGSAMGAAIAGALLGPVIGVLADALGFEVVFCGVGAVGVGLMAWTARTPAAKPEADGSLRGLWRALGNGDVRLSLALITVPGLLFGTLGVLGPLRLDDLGASAAAIGATWLLAAALEAIVSPLAGRFSDRRGRMAPMLAGLAGAAIVYALLPWPETAVLFALADRHRRAGRRPAVGALDGDAVRRRRSRRARAGARVRPDEPHLGDRPDARERRRRRARPGGRRQRRVPAAGGLCVAVFTALRIRGTQEPCPREYLRPRLRRARERAFARPGGCARRPPAPRHRLSRGRARAGGRLRRRRPDRHARRELARRPLRERRPVGRLGRRGQAPDRAPAQRRGHAGRPLRAPVRARLVRSRVRLLRARAPAAAGRRAPDADRAREARRQRDGDRGRPRLDLLPSRTARTRTRRSSARSSSSTAAAATRRSAARSTR